MIQDDSPQAHKSQSLKNGILDLSRSLKEKALTHQSENGLSGDSGVVSGIAHAVSHNPQQAKVIEHYLKNEQKKGSQLLPLGSHIRVGNKNYEKEELKNMALEYAKATGFISAQEEQEFMNPDPNTINELIKAHAADIEKEERERIAKSPIQAPRRKVKIPRKSIGHQYGKWTGGVCTATLILATSLAIGGDDPVSKQEDLLKKELGCYSESGTKICDAVNKVGQKR